jgi:hypothetical protein
LLESDAVDRPVEHEWRFDAVATQCCEEGQGFPVAERNEGPQASPARRPASSGAIFVLIQVSSMNTRRRASTRPLPGLPQTPAARDVSARLLAGEYGFF